MALNDAKVKAAKPKDKAYKLTDGGQLYLHVTTAGSKLFRMNYSFAGKQRTLSIGQYPIVTLAEAREKRDEAKRQLAAGRDPGLEKRLAARAQAQSYETTFQAVATRWFEQNKDRWSAHHAADVIRSLERDVFPSIGVIPITDLKPARILEVLAGIQARGSIETAHRIQQRMSAIFVYAIASGQADADPAGTVRGALKPIVRRGRQPSIIDRIDAHGAAAQSARIAAVRRVIADVDAASARPATKLAHRLLALTAVRPGEVRGAAWSELEGVDLTGTIYGPFRPTWIIPAARMKGDRDRKEERGGDHLVPLSMQAVDVLVQLHRVTGRSPLMFPNDRHIHRPMSENAIGYLLNRLGYESRHVPHGWRAAFSTIMNERPKHLHHAGDRAVIDLMLAHVPKDKVEGAYNRAAFMERRRELAQEWANTLLEDAVSALELVERR